MEWSVEFTDEFELWWNSLSEEEQEDVRSSVKVLQQHGPSLGVRMSIPWRDRGIQI